MRVCMSRFTMRTVARKECVILFQTRTLTLVMTSPRRVENTTRRATPLRDDDDDDDDDDDEDDDDDDDDDDGFCDDDDDDGGTPPALPPVRDAREQTTRGEPKNDAGDGDRG